MSTRSASPPPSRGWSSRLRTMLHLRPSRRRTSVLSASTVPEPTASAPHLSTTTTPAASRPPLAPAPRPLPATRRASRRRRRVGRMPSPDPRYFGSAASRPAATPPALRYRRPDLDVLNVTDTPDTNRASSTTAVSSALAELDAMQDRDLFAFVNRIFDEYQVDGPPGTAASQDPQHASLLYLGRLPHHARQRVAMRVHNAYYIAGARRPARHSHLTTELEREFRWSVRTLRFNAEGASQSYDYAASDDQIEALPAFVMEKGEQRSVQQIFASMGGAGAGDKQSAPSDECGGLMTGYTECAICLSDFQPGDEITLLPCGHFFHLTGCVREWLRNHASTCPTCRADICSPTGSSDGLASHSATVATSVEIS